MGAPGPSAGDGTSRDDEAGRDTDARGPDGRDTDDTALERTERRGQDGNGERRTRDVVVPMRLYKTVTVFSTLIAIVLVLGGFVMIDLATDRATAEVSEIDPLVAIVGLAGIVGGAAVYAFSTRFRAEGMGKHKDESDEPSDNG